jgi:hypothetical protein
VRPLSRREIARAAANHLYEHHRSAWGGVLLQIDWMTDVVEDAIMHAENMVQDTEAPLSFKLPK